LPATGVALCPHGLKPQNNLTLMLLQKVSSQMAKQKAPNARREIVSIETLHATSHYVRRNSEAITTVFVLAQQLMNFCNAINLK
jgi:hypothetical protein